MPELTEAARYISEIDSLRSLAGELVGALSACDCGCPIRRVQSHLSTIIQFSPRTIIQQHDSSCKKQAALARAAEMGVER